MTGEAHWMTLAWLAAAGLGVLVLLFFMFRLDRRFRNVFRRGPCPESGAEVCRTMVQDVRTGELTGVQSCSAFKVPTAVTCERFCVNAIRSDLTSETPAPAPGH